MKTKEPVGGWEFVLLATQVIVVGVLINVAFWGSVIWLAHKLVVWLTSGPSPTA